MATIVFITVWKNFGYFMVIFLAGLQGISAELYEAASLDGASAWQKFRYITLPALRPTFNYVVIFGLIGSFQVFDQVFILTSGARPAPLKPSCTASTPSVRQRQARLRVRAVVRAAHHDAHRRPHPAVHQQQA